MAKSPPSHSLPKDGICVIHLLWGKTDAQADDFRPQQLCRASSAPLPCVSRGCERTWDSRGHFWLTRKISLQDSLSNGHTSLSAQLAHLYNSPGSGTEELRQSYQSCSLLVPKPSCWWLSLDTRKLCKPLGTALDSVHQENHIASQKTVGSECQLGILATRLTTSLTSSEPLFHVWAYAILMEMSRCLPVLFTHN